MINFKKIKNKDDMNFDFDLLTDFSRTKRNQINLDTEIPHIKNINQVSSLQSINVNKIDTNTNELKSNISESNKLKTNIDNYNIGDNLDNLDYIDYIDDIDNIDNKDNNIDNNINTILDNNKCINDIINNNYESSESKLKEYNKKYNINDRCIVICNNNINKNNFNKDEIDNIYKYLKKYKSKIIKKLINKNIIKSDKIYSDKLFFCLYLNYIFYDITNIYFCISFFSSSINNYIIFLS